MGTRTPPTFNTVKHSNRDKHVKKQQKQRALLLGMIAVSILLVITLLVFAIFAIVSAVTASPADTIQYQDATKFSAGIEEGALVVINPTYSIESISASAFTTLSTSDIPSVDGNPIYKVARSMQLHTDAKAAFDAMMKEYYNIYGSSEIVTVKDAYRPISSGQASGKSDHHSGYLLALDIAQITSPDHWIFKNCHKYGFVLRYPEEKQSITQVGTSVTGYDYTEAIRYVGVAHATYMKNNNLCLEEYVQRLQSHPIDAQLQIDGADGKLYTVYYVPSATTDLTQLKIPSNYSYEISGDNIGGFIVTVNLSDPRA